MSSLAKADILGMSVSERIQLVEDIWDSLVDAPEKISLTEAQKTELDKRLDDYRRNPEAGSPWEIVRELIRNRR